MNIVILTNDNFFSYTVLKNFFELKKSDIKLIIFSSALIGKKGTIASIKWSLINTGFRHTVFKLMVYGIFRVLKVICKFLPFIPNQYSTRLWAQQNAVNAIDANNINDPEIVEQIKAANPELMISVSMNQIVKKKILEIPLRKCINVHCAPLPRYAGMSPYVWALANNESSSAATIHYMEEGLDEGNIILQEKVNVLKGDSAFSLFYRCCQKAGEFLIQVVNEIESGIVKSYEQDLSSRSYFSWPTKECVNQLRKNGYCLVTVMDFIKAVFQQKPRLH